MVPWLTRHSLSAESLKVSLIRSLATNWTADSLLTSTTSSRKDRTRGFHARQQLRARWQHRCSCIGTPYWNRKRRKKARTGAQMIGPKGHAPQKILQDWKGNYTYAQAHRLTNTTSETRKSQHTITKGKRGKKPSPKMEWVTHTRTVAGQEILAQNWREQRQKALAQAKKRPQTRERKNKTGHWHSLLAGT